MGAGLAAFGPRPKARLIKLLTLFGLIGKIKAPFVKVIRFF
jgi:hypothetical protein